jgi:5-methylcytosine-specific restriction endonuclease McrA
MKQKAVLKSKTRLKAKTTLRASKTPKKQKKPTITKLKKEADKWFSKYVRLRDGGVCITCGDDKGQMQCGHFMSRRYNATRYEEENCNAQCYRCNVLFYGEQYKYAKEIDLKYGDGTAKKLSEMAAQSHPFTIEELEQVIADSKEAISFYEKLV